VQSPGLTAYGLESDLSAVYAFKAAVAGTMPGIYAEDITINLIISLGGGLDPITPRFPTDEPTMKPVSLFGGDDDGGANVYYDDDYVAPSMQPSARRRRLSTDDDAAVVAHFKDYDSMERELFLGTTPENPTGIAVNYNVTLPIQRLGYNDPDLCFAVLSAQLVDSIASGNFTALIQEEAVNNGVDSILGSASTSSSDYAGLAYVRIATSLVTSPPSSYPTSTPSQPTTTPTSGPTKPPPIRPVYFEIVAGLVLTSVALGLFYVTSIILGIVRVDNVAVPKSEKKSNADHISFDSPALEMQLWSDDSKDDAQLFNLDKAHIAV